MNALPLGVSLRSMTIAAALAGLVSLAIGAHAALNNRTPGPVARVVGIEPDAVVAGMAQRVALVIGNGHYPDASAPLSQPLNDARALTAALRRDGFEVDLIEDAGKDELSRAIGRLQARIRPDSVVMLFFGGYGVQVGRESYMIPVDATIWSEADVRRDGVSVESVLDAMKQQGACAKLVVLDASRRNPYERRFRAFSHGLAPIHAPDNALILTSALPDQLIDDSEDRTSALVSELLHHLNAEASGAEDVFNRTKVAVARASDGKQVPAVSSTLLEPVRLGGASLAGG